MGTVSYRGLATTKLERIGVTETIAAMIHFDVSWACPSFCTTGEQSGSSGGFCIIVSVSERRCIAETASIEGGLM